MIYVFCVTMKNSLSWITLVNWEKRKNVKFWWDPKFTNAFLDSLELENKEWKKPPVWDITIFRYHDSYHHMDIKYTINREWEIKTLKWKVMKPSFHKNKKWPRIRVKLGSLDDEWNVIFKEKEISVLQMMEKIFWPYFPWYKLKQKNPKDYILVTKDWDYKNMRYDNLCYVHKDELYSPKKKTIKEYLLLHTWADDRKVSELCHAAESYVKKIKMELISVWKLPEFWEYQDLQKELWIEFTEDNLRIYQALVQSQWKLSNLEIATLLRPEEIKTGNKRVFTDKVVRARKRLTDKWVIPRFNEWFESKKAKALKMLKNKTKTHKTNQEIADKLWLAKHQVDNLARQVKKQEQKKS